MHTKSVPLLLAGVLGGCASASLAHAEASDVHDRPLATAPREYERSFPSDERLHLLPAGRSALVNAVQATNPIAVSDCRGTVMLGVGKGYVLPYYGFDAADGNPVAESEVSYSCAVTSRDRMGVAVAAVKPLSGTRGNVGEEQSLTAMVRHEEPMRFGSADFGATVSYRALNRFGVSRDDDLELIGGGGLTFGTGTLRLRIGGSYVRDVPIKDTNILNWAVATIDLTASNPSGGSCHLGADFVHNINSYTAVIHKNAWYGKVDCTSSPWHRVAVTGGVSFAQYNQRDSAYRLYTERRGDGKIFQAPRGGGAREDGPVVGVFAKVAIGF